ncbi:MAG: hypothetical protein MJE68_05440, partial [Proteobacteria bacterium]|nr:hypothetical protein [Pseudomonadota bacterium]
PNGDYVAPPPILTATTGTLTIDPNTASYPIALFTLKDSDIEGDEGITLTLSNPSGAELDSIGNAPLSASVTINDNTTAPPVALPQVSVTASPASINEGSEANFTIVLDKPASAAVAVTYRVTDNATGGVGEDYTTTPALTAGSGFAIIAAGDTNYNLTVTASEDGVAGEGEEAVTFTFITVLDPPSGDPVAELSSEAGDTTATITIIDTTPPPPPPSVRVVATPASVNEGESATFTISLNETTTEDVEVEYLLGGTASRGADYTTTSPRVGSVTIAGGAQSATITITTIADETTEGRSEAVTIILTDVVGTNAVLSATPADRTATITIADTSITPAPLPSVSVSANPASINEGDSATFTITLSDTTSQAVEVDYILGGSATRVNDYTTPASAIGSVTIAGGSQSATITITTIADETTEGSDETVTIILADVGDNAELSSNTADLAASVTILDTSTTPIALPTLSLAAPATIDEDETFNFTVILSETRVEDVTVEYALTGNATLGSFIPTPSGDYLLPPLTFATGTLTIQAGRTNATLPIVVRGDNTTEGEETITLTLTNPTEATLAGTGIASVTIADTSTTPVPTTPPTTDPAGFTIGVTSHDVATQRVIEGQNLNFTIYTEGSKPLAEAVDLTVRLQGLDRSRYSLHDVGYLIGANTSATLLADELVDEFRAEYTIPFTAGATNATLITYIGIGSDGDHEDSTVNAPATLRLAVLDAPEGIAQRNFNVTMTDNDPGLRLRRGSGGANADFGTIAAGTPLDFRLVYQPNNVAWQGVARTFRLAYTGADNIFIDPPETVTIEAGNRNANFTIRTASVTNGGEFSVGILVNEGVGDPITHYSIDPGFIEESLFTGTLRASATPPPSVALVEDVSVDEGDEAVFTVRLNPPNTPSAPVTIYYVTEDGTATAGEDYTAVNGSVVINTGNSATIRIPALPDSTLGDDDETFTVRLTGATNAVLSSTASDLTATATIADTTVQAEAFEVSFGNQQQPYERDEVTFAITNTTPLSGNVTVPIRISNVGGIGFSSISFAPNLVGSPLTITPAPDVTDLDNNGSLTIRLPYPAVTSGLFGFGTTPTLSVLATLTPTDDDVDMVSSTITVTLLDDANAPLSGTGKTASIIIADDDPIISITSNATSVMPGDSFNITIQAETPALAVDNTIQLDYSNRGLVNETDTQLPNTVTIEAGDNNTNLTLTFVSDAAATAEFIARVLVNTDTSDPITPYRLASDGPASASASASVVVAGDLEFSLVVREGIDGGVSADDADGFFLRESQVLDTRRISRNIADFRIVSGARITSDLNVTLTLTREGETASDAGVIFTYGTRQATHNFTTEGNVVTLEIPQDTGFISGRIDFDDNGVDEGNANLTITLTDPAENASYALSDTGETTITIGVFDDDPVLDIVADRAGEFLTGLRPLIDSGGSANFTVFNDSGANTLQTHIIPLVYTDADGNPVSGVTPNNVTMLAGTNNISFDVTAPDTFAGELNVAIDPSPNNADSPSHYSVVSGFGGAIDEVIYNSAPPALEVTFDHTTRPTEGDTAVAFIISTANGEAVTGDYYVPMNVSYTGGINFQALLVANALQTRPTNTTASLFAALMPSGSNSITGTLILPRANDDVDEESSNVTITAIGSNTATASIIVADDDPAVSIGLKDGDTAPDGPLPVGHNVNFTVTANSPVVVNNIIQLQYSRPDLVADNAPTSVTIEAGDTNANFTVSPNPNAYTSGTFTVEVVTYDQFNDAVTNYRLNDGATRRTPPIEVAGSPPALKVRYDDSANATHYPVEGDLVTFVIETADGSPLTRNYNVPITINNDGGNDLGGIDVTGVIRFVNDETAEDQTALPTPNISRNYDPIMRRGTKNISVRIQTVDDLRDVTFSNFTVAVRDTNVNGSILVIDNDPEMRIRQNGTDVLTPIDTPLVLTGDNVSLIVFGTGTLRAEETILLEYDPREAVADEAPTSVTILRNRAEAVFTVPIADNAPVGENVTVRAYTDNSIDGDITSYRVATAPDSFNRHHTGAFNITITDTPPTPPDPEFNLVVGNTLQNLQVREGGALPLVFSITPQDVDASSNGYNNADHPAGFNVTLNIAHAAGGGSTFASGESGTITLTDTSNNTIPQFISTSPPRSVNFTTFTPPAAGESVEVTLPFIRGAVDAVVMLPITDDNADLPASVITATIVNSTGANRASASATIVDNDPVISVSTSGRPQTVEAGENITLAVSTPGGFQVTSDHVIQLAYSTSEGVALDNPPASVTIPARGAGRSFNVTTAPNSLAGTFNVSVVVNTAVRDDAGNPLPATPYRISTTGNSTEITVTPRPTTTPEFTLAEIGITNQQHTTEGDNVIFTITPDELPLAADF